jgi:hypothetical protein
MIFLGSVVDPDPDPSDPYVFGPPGSESGSISQWYESGSFYPLVNGMDPDLSITKQK